MLDDFFDELATWYSGSRELCRARNVESSRNYWKRQLTFQWSVSSLRVEFPDDEELEHKPDAIADLILPLQMG
jgi:hypothetical protein